MQLLESVKLKELRSEMKRYSGRRKHKVTGLHDDDFVKFYQWKSFLLAELVSKTKILGRGVAKRSTTCIQCGGGMDKDNLDIGKTIAFWRALDDLEISKPKKGVN